MPAPRVSDLLICDVQVSGFFKSLFYSSAKLEYHVTEESVMIQRA